MSAKQNEDLLMKFYNVQFKPELSNPFQYLKDIEGLANTERNLMRDKSRDSQIEAVLELIKFVKEQNAPSGLVLNPSKVTAEKPQEVKDMLNVKRVLGEGNSAGEILVVQDGGTGQEVAVKTVAVCRFNPDEIRAWVHLADMGKAPELYYFNLVNSEVVMKMEILEGTTLREVFNSPGFKELLSDPQKSQDKQCFSLLLLHDLLENFSILKKGGFTHGDGHGGNVMVSPTLDIKLIDFGSAKRIRLEDGINHTARLKADIVNILRHFCYAYSGFDFNTQGDATKVLSLESYQEFAKKMPDIPEVDRKWLFDVISFVMNKVRDATQEGYAEMYKTKFELERMMPLRAELEVIRTRVAALLFPEKVKKRHHESEFHPEMEIEMDEGADPVLDDPELADLATLVDLKVFGESSLF